MVVTTGEALMLATGLAFVKELEMAWVSVARIASVRDGDIVEALELARRGGMVLGAPLEAELSAGRVIT